MFISRSCTWLYFTIKFTHPRDSFSLSFSTCAASLSVASPHSHLLHNSTFQSPTPDHIFNRHPSSNMTDFLAYNILRISGAMPVGNALHSPCRLHKAWDRNVLNEDSTDKGDAIARELSQRKFVDTSPTRSSSISTTYRCTGSSLRPLPCLIVHRVAPRSSNLTAHLRISEGSPPLVTLLRQPHEPQLLVSHVQICQLKVHCRLHPCQRLVLALSTAAASTTFAPVRAPVLLLVSTPLTVPTASVTDLLKPRPLEHSQRPHCRHHKYSPFNLPHHSQTRLQHPQLQRLCCRPNTHRRLIGRSR